jgi:hypothetical protein
MALISQRNAKMFAKLGGVGAGNSPAGGSPSDQGTWEIPILAGFSFGQTTNSTEVNVSEAGAISRRARVMFNDSLAPVEFSFSTYIRPTAGTSPTRVVAPEQVLWAMLMGADAYNPSSGTFYSTIQATFGSPAQGVSPTTSPTGIVGINTGSATSTSDTFDFSASNVSFYPTGNNIIFQIQEGSNYEIFTIANAQISSVTIDFDIEGICTAQWSGMGTSITRSNTTTATTPSFTTGTTSTTNFIRNKLSVLKIGSYTSSGSPAVGSPGLTPDTYDIVLTGGSFTVENNLNFLMPEELGKVNQTIGNITGVRSISGSLTCYYDTDLSGGKSSELWNDLITGQSGGGSGTIPAIRNAHYMEISIGGQTGNRLVLALPTAHLEIPTINPDELFTLEANFHAMPSQGNFDRTDEATVTYGI